MSFFEQNEPDHSNSIEIVDAGKLFTGTDITLIYNPTTGGQLVLIYGFAAKRYQHY